MTPEQRQAVVDKIMRMAVRIEPADLRYDVNNDGKVSSADAFRVHTGTEATDITNLARSLDGWQPLGTDWEWVWNQYTSLGEHGVIKNKVTGEQYLTKPSPQGDKESIQKQAESLVYILNAPELADRVKTYSIAIPWRAVNSGIPFWVDDLPDLSDPSYIQNLTKEAGIYRLQGQLASVVDPNSSGGAWSDKPGKSSGPGFGPMGFLAVMAENLYNQTGLTDLNKLGVRDFGEGVEYFNKDTGKAVNFNGTLGGYGEGVGWTYTSLNFKDGKPVLKTTGEDTSDLGTIMPIISLALLAFPGVGQAVGSLLVPAGTSAAVTAAVGSAVVNAGIQIASGVPVEDALKTAAITLAVPSVIPDLTSSAVLNNAIRSAATSIALGADPEKAILSSVMSAAATSIGSKLSLTGQKGVDQAIANVLGSVVKNVALGQDITEALTQGAINAAVAAGVESLGAGQNLTKDEKSVLTVAANAIVNAARTGQFNPLQIAGQLSAIGLSKADAAKTVAAEAANLPKSNTAIGAIAVDNSGELFVMDDDGNRMMLSGVAAGRVYTPDEWVSIKGALNAGQAQYVNSLISAMNKGVMTPEEVAEDLHASGYSDDTTGKIFSANEQYIYRANQAQKIAQDYSAVGSDIDRDNAINQLKVLGYSAGEATGFIDNIDRQVAAKIQNVVTKYKEITGSEPTDLQIQQFKNIGGGDVEKGFDLSTITEAEARSFFEANGYSATDAEVKQFAGLATEEATRANIANYIDPRQTDYAEALAMLGELGYNPSDSEIEQFIGQVNKDVARQNIASYVGPRQTTYAEARSFLEANGYNPSDDEVRQFVGQINKDVVDAEANKVLRMAVNKEPADLRYDANKDGKISSSDALAILKDPSLIVKQNISDYVAPKVQKISDVFDYLNQGKLSPEQAEDELLRFGFKTEQIPAIFAANADAVDRSRKAQDIVNDYADIGSDLSREAAVQRLVQEAGVTETAANNYLSRVDAQVTARNEYVNTARDFVANKLGTSEQATDKLKAALDKIGVIGDQQNEVVDAYNKMRLQAAGAELTPSEMTNLAVLSANKTNWVALPGKSGHEVAFALTDEGDPYVVAARDKDGNNLLNVYQNLTPQGVMQVVNAQLAQARAAEQTKGAPNQYAVDKEISDAASAAGLARTTGMIRNNFSTVNTDYFNNLLRQYSAMSPEDRAKIASASGVTTDLRVLKDIDAQYKEIDQQYAAAVANNSPTAKLYKSLDTRVENKAGYYYTNNGVQPSTAMAMAIQDLQGGNLFNRVNLSEFEDSKFPFETKQFINQFRGNPIGDKLSDVLANAYAIGARSITDSLNGSLGISLHIAETFGLDSFAEDFQKMSLGLRQAGEDATTIAGADTREHKNFIGGLSNLVSAIPWLMAGPAGIPGLLASVGATTYGNSYLDARLKGESIENSSERATYMALIEIVTERFGLGDLTKLLKPTLQNVPINQIAKVASESLVPQLAKYMTKEQIGELTAFSLQFATDKYADVGLNKQSTGLDFLQGAIDTIQQTFWAAGAAAGIPIGLRGGMTPDNSGQIKVISPDGTQGLVELGNGSIIRVDIPEGIELKAGEDININALKHDSVYVPDNVNEKFNNLETQLKDVYQTELGRPPTFEELDFNVKRLADGTDIQAVANELNNSQAGQLLDQRNTFNAQTDQQIAANAKLLLNQGRTTYADFKTFMDSMGLASDRQLNVLDAITPRTNVPGTVTSIVGNNAIVTGNDGQMYTMLRVASYGFGPSNYLMQVGDQVNLGVSTVKPTATPTVEVTTKIADVIAASVSTSTSLSISQSISQAAISTSISNSQSVSTSLSQSESISVSAATSISESVSQSVSLSQSVSTADMERAISISNSVSQSLSVSQAISLSASISEATSLSVSNSQSVSTSISQATSVSEALSLSVSISEQIEKDRLKGLSISASVSESVSKAVSISESVSVATSISESTSASISNSQSVSVAASISESVSFSTSQSTSVSQALSTQASISEAVSISVAASTSQSISVSQEVSKQVSISQSTSQSVALSQSVSQDQAVSLAASISQSTSQSISEALSISEEAQAMLNASISQSQSISQEISANVIRGMSISASVSEALSISQSISELIQASLSASLSQVATISVTEAISISETVAPTLSITQSLSIEPSVAPTVAPTISATQQITQTESFTQTPSLTMVITTTSLPPVTTTEVATTEPLTTVIETTVTIPPVTLPPTSGTIPPVTPPVTTTSPPPVTTTSPPPTTTAKPAVTTARPPTTTARPNTGLFPLFGLPAAGEQQTTYVDYAQPNVPAPEFGPYDLFKAPSYLRPLQDSGNFGLAALIGAASESQQRNGDNQSQQNAQGQGQAPTG